MSGTIADKLSLLASTKAAIKQAIIDKGVEVSSNDTFASYAEKIDDIPTGAGDTIEATNLTGQSIAVGDKVFIKRQAAQQSSSVDFFSHFSNWCVMNATGTKIIGDTGIYDIKTGAYTSAAISEYRMTKNAVLKYEGDKIFAHGLLFENSGSSTNFFYCQDHYTVSWTLVDNKCQVNKYDNTFSSITNSWLIEGLPNTSEILDFNVIGNKLYLIKYDTNYIYMYMGTIDSESSTINVTSIKQYSWSGRTDRTFFNFRLIGYPSNSTIDNSLGICGNYAYDRGNGTLGISFVSFNSNYEITGDFITSNSDLQSYQGTATGMTFNRGTGILTVADSNTVGIFKYNQQIVDFDTISIVSIPDITSKGQTTLSNDLEKLNVPKKLFYLEVSEGGYNAVPYVLGSDVLTGFATSAASHGETFYVNTVLGD